MISRGKLSESHDFQAHKKAIDSESKGLIARVLDHLYEVKEKHTNAALHISFIELYNDQVTDLLVTREVHQDHLFTPKSASSRGGSNTGRTSSKTQTLSHQVKENHIRGVYVENITEKKAETVDQAYSMFLSGL